MRIVLKVCLVGPCSPADICHLVYSEYRDDVNRIQAFRGIPVSSLASQLVTFEHQVTVVTTSPEVENCKRFFGPNFALIVLPQRRRARNLALTLYGSEVLSISRVIRKLNVDIVHAHWTYEYALGALFAHKPCVVTAHDAPWQVFRTAGSKKFWFFRFVLAWIVRLNVKLMTFVSIDLYSKWQREMLWRGESRVIPNLPPFEVNLETSSVPKADQFRILTIGDTSERKNIQTLIKAFNLLKKQYPKLELHVVGVGLEFNGSYAQNHPGAITWHGYLERDSLARLMQSCHVLVQPSLLESFGLTLLESMALGICVIAGHNTGAAKEVVGDAGILIDTRNTSEYVIAISRLIENPELRMEMESLGRLRISEVFDTSKIIRETLNCYEIAIQKWSD
jgi:glycosyltransferase involved in cell wall biosynthesis